MKHILLLCGAGMSSGFIAQRMRKSAKKRKLELKIDAVSESDADSYLDRADLLLIGPHLPYIFDVFESKAGSLGIPMMIIPEDVYGSLDGEKLLEISIEKLSMEEKENGSNS